MRTRADKRDDSLTFEDMLYTKNNKTNPKLLFTQNFDPTTTNNGPKNTVLGPESVYLNIRL